MTLLQNPLSRHFRFQTISCFIKFYISANFFLPHRNRQNILISLQRFESVSSSSFPCKFLFRACSRAEISAYIYRTTQATDAMLAAMWHELCKFKFTRLGEFQAIHLTQQKHFYSCDSVIHFCPTLLLHLLVKCFSFN